MTDIDESDCSVVQKRGKGGGEVGSKIMGVGAGFEDGGGESGVQNLRGEEDGTQEGRAGPQEPQERPKRATERASVGTGQVNALSL
jgi:hypothetical protein